VRLFSQQSVDFLGGRVQGFLGGHLTAQDELAGWLSTSSI
jgi:hypothetical protein